MIAKGSSGTTQYFLSDRLSERLVLDTSGNVSGRESHLPFGEDFGESGTQEKHHFTSYERDGEAGTDYAVNRGYSPVVGRFNQIDPVSGSASDPQGLNRYAYVHNSPTNNVDPLGLLEAGLTFSCTSGFVNGNACTSCAQRIGDQVVVTISCRGGASQPPFGNTIVINLPPNVGGPGGGGGDPQSPCDRARAALAKWDSELAWARTEYEDWIKHIGQESGQSAAVNNWLNELHSPSTAVANAIEVANHLGQILRTAASAYANGKKDIYKLQSKETEFDRAFTYARNRAEAVKRECNDSSDLDRFTSAEPWNNAFFAESDKIVNDILKDWKPPY